MITLSLDKDGAMTNKKEKIGNYNTGYRNTGWYNTGNSNIGNRNTGDHNIGDYNTGDSNTSDSNIGDSNTGDHNTGYRNAGHYNSGHYNTGWYNTGNYNTGHFNTTEGTIRMFNKDTGRTRDEITLPYIDIKLTKWIDIDDMPDAEKSNHPKASTVGGYLKSYTYHEAWQIVWNRLDDSKRKEFLDLPNFDAEIFKRITGVDVNSKVKIEVDGKIVYISRESAIALNLIKE